MPFEDNLAEEFVVTTLKRYLQEDPQEAIELAIQFYKQNSELRHRCRCLCESSNELTAESAKLIKTNQKLQSFLNKSRFQLLLLSFLLSLTVTLFCYTSLN